MWVLPRNLTNWYQTLPFLKGSYSTFSKPSFWVSMLVFGYCLKKILGTPSPTSILGFWLQTNHCQWNLLLWKLTLLPEIWWLVQMKFPFFFKVPFFWRTFVHFRGCTWRIIPVSKWLVTTIYKPWKRPFKRGTTPFRGLTVLTMVINHVS